MKSPGELIKEKRKDRGLTLQNVADHLGISKMTVSKWENGQIQNIRRDNLIPLCSLLGLSPIQLIDSVEVEQTITINGFKSQISYLLHRVPSLEENEKELIRNYIDLICTNKGE